MCGWLSDPGARHRPCSLPAGALYACLTCARPRTAPAEAHAFPWTFPPPRFIATMSASLTTPAPAAHPISLARDRRVTLLGYIYIYSAYGAGAWVRSSAAAPPTDWLAFETVSKAQVPLAQRGNNSPSGRPRSHPTSSNSHFVIHPSAGLPSARLRERPRPRCVQPPTSCIVSKDQGIEGTRGRVDKICLFYLSRTRLL